MTLIRALRAHLTIAGIFTGLAIVLTVAAAVKGWPPNVQPLITGGVGVLLGGLAYRVLHQNERSRDLADHQSIGFSSEADTITAQQAELLTLTLRDGRRFITRDDTYRHASLPPTWVEFDCFVRSTLKERLGVEDVETFQVSDDGEFLLPMSESELRTEHLVSARTGSLGAAVSSGRISLEDAPPGNGPRNTARDCWLLPLRSQARTTSIVRILGWPMPAPIAAQLAGPLREQLEYLWHTVFALQRQAFAERCEATGGVLTRGELLTMLDRRVREAYLTAGAISLLAVHVEGADLLEQSGLWPEHDAIVGLIGENLQSCVPQGCAVGRLTDRTFLLLLRDVDFVSDGGVVSALLRNAQSTAVSALEQISAQAYAGCDARFSVTLRAGFATLKADAGGDWHPARPHLENDEHAPVLAGFRNMSNPARSIVRRATGLAMHASSQGLDLVHDLDTTLPGELQNPGAVASGGKSTKSEAHAEFVEIKGHACG